jgi:surface polysaccharide O-acyltransferase-like enzyme
LEGTLLGRNVALDILKLSMAFMVVGIHAEFLKDISVDWSYFTAYGIFRIAVPVFLLISGFYFYQTLENNKTLIWFKRCLLLYCFWMLVYSIFWFKPAELSLKMFFIQLIVGYYHLWYVAGMIGAAVILLVIRRFNSPMLIFISIATYLIGVVIQYAGNYHLLENARLDNIININFVHRNALFFSLPFFCIGYLIHKHNLHTRISFTTAKVFTAIGLILMSAEIYFNYIAPDRDGGFDNFFSLIILCPALFILFMHINLFANTKNIALYATAIYFVHPLFLLPLTSLLATQATLFTLVVIALSVIAAYFLIIINKKAKFIL